MSEYLLKDLISETFAMECLQRLQKEGLPFSSTSIQHEVLQDWETLELMGRIRQIEDIVLKYNTLAFPEFSRILCQVGKHYSGLQGLCFPGMIAKAGLDFWEESMTALETLTVYSTSEFAVRPFIEKEPIRTMQKMKEWSGSACEHVRRLSSEGCRPKLPWGKELPLFRKDPSPVLDILDTLKQDSSLYVRKSVANNLNDISKDHPQKVLEMANQWSSNDLRTAWILKRGLRTLLKDSNPEALAFFGYKKDLGITSLQLNLEPTALSIGDDLTIQLEWDCDSVGSKLRLEYIIDFVRPQGKRSSKVFQWLDGVVEKEHWKKSKKHSFKQLSTRKHFAGEHQIHIRINGKIMVSQTFSVN